MGCSFVVWFPRCFGPICCILGRCLVRFPLASSFVVFSVQLFCTLLPFSFWLLGVSFGSQLFQPDILAISEKGLNVCFKLDLPFNLVPPLFNSLVGESECFFGHPGEDPNNSISPSSSNDPAPCEVIKPILLLYENAGKQK